MWRAILDGTDPVYARTRGRLKHLPGAPRCKMCAAPFGGPAGILDCGGAVHAPGQEPQVLPQLLPRPVAAARRRRDRVDVLLFADFRGSTALAEGISPTEFRRRLDRFYDIASRLLVEHDAIVDKFVGDEVIGIFIPALAHEAHAARAIAAGLALPAARRPAMAIPGGPSLPIGIGVGTGIAFVGAVGVTHTAAS